MKKFAAFLVILSIGLFTVGCGEKKATPPAGKDAKPAAGAPAAGAPAADAKDAKDTKK